MSKEKEKQIKLLARRFSLEQWNHLCTKPDFLQLLNEGEIESAKVFAHNYFAVDRNTYSDLFNKGGSA